MKKLVFVYNGDSGLVNGLMHYLHKRISPQTYSCQLCALFYEGLSLNKDWLAFVRTLDIPVEYQHRDEYTRLYGESSQVWPAVLLHEGANCIATVISSGDFTELNSLEALQSRLLPFVAPAESAPQPA